MRINSKVTFIRSEMKIFTQYFKLPTASVVLNTKLLLLTKGLDCDFSSIKKTYPALKARYKVNKIRVSDRHFLSPASTERDFIPDELILEEGNQKSVVKVYFKKDSPFLFCWNFGFFNLKKKSKFLTRDLLDSKTG